MLEDIMLKGTLLKMLRNQPNIDFNHSIYITYDNTNKKFYGLLLGHQHRFIVVAHDLMELEKLMIQKLPDTVSQFKSADTIDAELDTLETPKFKEWIHRVLKFMLTIGHARFRLPWRWREWTENYDTVLEMYHEG